MIGRLPSARAAPAGAARSAATSLRSRKRCGRSDAIGSDLVCRPQADRIPVPARGFQPSHRFRCHRLATRRCHGRVLRPNVTRGKGAFDPLCCPGQHAIHTLMNLDHEDAFKILVAMLAARPDGYTDGNRPPMYDVWIPRIMDEFFRSNRIDTKGDPSFYHREEFQGVWRVFYDAAWQLCRRGIFRPGMSCPEGQGTGWGPPGDGFALTNVGREWLKHAADAYFPTDPGRYVKTLERPGRLLGGGFLQRAGEQPHIRELSRMLCHVRGGGRIRSSCNRDSQNQRRGRGVRCLPATRWPSKSDAHHIR